MEKVDTRRSFEVLSETGTRKYYIAMPNADQVKKADWHYSKVFNQALVDGITTSAEMLDTLKKRGLYGSEYEEQAEELRAKIAEKLLAMESTTNPIEKYNFALEVKNLRDELFQWNQRLTGPMRNTCEQIAEDAKVEFLTSMIVQDEVGRPVWKNYDAFLSDSDQFLTMRARIEVYLWVQGMDRDFLDKVPENRVIDEFLTQKTVEAEKVSEPVEETALVEAPKKRARSKKAE